MEFCLFLIQEFLQTLQWLCDKVGGMLGNFFFKKSFFKETLCNMIDARPINAGEFCNARSRHFAFLKYDQIDSDFFFVKTQLGKQCLEHASILSCCSYRVNSIYALEVKVLH